MKKIIQNHSYDGSKEEYHFSLEKIKEDFAVYCSVGFLTCISPV